MSAARTGQIFVVGTGHMYGFVRGQSPVAMVDICLVSVADTYTLSASDTCPVSTADVCHGQTKVFQYVRNWGVLKIVRGNIPKFRRGCRVSLMVIEGV